MTASRAMGLALAVLLSTALLAPAPVAAQDAQPRIVGGTTAEAGEYPWQVAVLKKQGQSLYFICGGTLIADQRVVTAAHCTSGSASSIKVLVGTQELSTGGSVLDISSYADHPSYSSTTNRFDAAVLELATSGIAAGGETLSLIGEEGSADDALWAPGKLLAISGWGTTSEGGSVSEQLREAEVPRVADSTCGQSDYYGSAFDAATMICAGFAAGGVDTCQGDSGGPLAASTQDPLPVSAQNPSQWRLAGITSWGAGCAREKKPGVYTRVAAPAIRDWILGSTPPDTTPPDTQITDGPSGDTTDTTPTFAFSSTEANSTFVCQIDQALPAPCDSPHTTEPLGTGAHVFSVTARDPANNVDPTPATRAFTVVSSSPAQTSPTQTTPTQTTIVAVPDFTAPAIGTFRLSRTVFRAARSGPAIASLVGTRISLTLSEGATVTFRVAKLVAGRRVMLRGRIVRKLAAGTSRLLYRGRLRNRALRPGRYRLLVRARDAAGNLSSRRQVAFRIVR